MKNLRRIMAIAGIVLLIAVYASTMVFALMKHPMADRFLMASVFCTVAVPVLLYGMILVARNLERRGEELRREAELRHEAELQREAELRREVETRYEAGAEPEKDEGMEKGD